MKIFLLLCLISLYSSFEVPPELTSICPEGCKRYYKCDPILQKCVYKGFFPLYPLEMFEVLLLCISSALATACGIGGGTVYSAMLLGVQEFEPLEAFPISNCLILSCGLVTYLACVLDKYKNPKNKFVDYDMAIIFGPSMLLGAKFGTIFNKIFSSFFLTIAVLIVLCYSINSTYKNVQKAKEREAKMESDKEKQGEIANNKAESLIVNNDHKTEVIELISFDTNDNNHQGKKLSNNEKKHLTAEEEEILHEDDNPIRMDRIKFMIILECIVVVDQLLEGNSKLPSFIGISRCSFLYWLVFLGYILISLYLIKIALGQVYSHYEIKKLICKEGMNNERVKNITENTTKIVLVAILAGIISSMVGIGGGMITNPMFASLGLDPKESSTTSNFLIITTAIASTFLFTFAGQLNVSFAFFMTVPCTIAAFIGSFLILSYINKTKKNSILLVIMFYFLIASLLIILFKAIFSFNANTIPSFFTLNNYC